MTYQITPAHLGITKRLHWVLALGTLACFALLMLVFRAWNAREIVTGLLTWLVIEFVWYFQTHYSLEVDDNSVRLAGGRAVRKGRVRYLREIDSPPWRGGPRLVLSEHGPFWARLFCGVVVIPKGLPEYEQINGKVFSWKETSEAHDPQQGMESSK